MVTADYFGSDDLDEMLSAFGQPVEYRLNGEPFNVYGIVDESDSDLMTGEAATFAGRLFTVLVKTGALPGIGEGATVEVAGTSYSVVQVRRQDDGALTKLFLA